MLLRRAVRVPRDACFGCSARHGRLNTITARRARPAHGMSLRAISNENNAFIEPDLRIQRSREGPLSGLTFASKDLFDIEGYVTGYGQPTWKATHYPAAHTSPAVQALLDAGADLVGKTHLDELAYSLNGENIHYGTPVNPAAPDRIPGGSSSGSAVATADGTVDIGLGSDTGGSIRVPSSYCGLLGLRPSHGRVSLQHACTLARSFDTCGWFTRDAKTLRQVGDVLLDPATKQDALLTRWLNATDAFDNSDKETSTAIYELVKRHYKEVTELIGEPQEVTVASAEGLSSLKDWREVFRIIQGAEIWEELGEWITENKPAFGPGTKERFQKASNLQPQEVQQAKEDRKKITAHMHQLLGTDGLLMLPSCPGPAPILNTPPEELNLFRARLLSLTCIAGLAGLPQVSLPVLTVDGCPVGLSLIGPPGSDEALLDLTKKLMRILKN